MWEKRALQFLASLALGGSLIIPAASASTNATTQSDATVSVVPTDPLFAEPYIDKDEWRNAPVRHRYIHGGFKGTDTRFSIYLPPKKQYKGRFFQHITPVPDDENLAQKDPVGSHNKIGFSIASGAYFLETNGGGKMDLGKVRGPASDANVTAFRANAAAASGHLVTPMADRAVHIAPLVQSRTQRVFGMAWYLTFLVQRWLSRTCLRSGCTPCAS